MTVAQRWDPERYRANAGFVAALGAPLVAWLAPKPGERVLDLGCGDGALTVKLVEAGATAIGVDSSPEQVAAARDRGLDARPADGAALPFHSEFDAVFSNAALHWMRPPERVVAGVARALSPGGRFVAEMGGAGNVAKIEAALIAALDRRGIDGRAASPWYFPTQEEYGALLARHGLAVERMELFSRPTELPGDMAAWLDTFAEPFLGRLDTSEREAAVAETIDELRPRLVDSRGVWIVDYVRLRFAAVKKA